MPWVSNTNFQSLDYYPGLPIKQRRYSRSRNNRWQLFHTLAGTAIASMSKYKSKSKGKGKKRAPSSSKSMSISKSRSRSAGRLDSGVATTSRATSRGRSLTRRARLPGRLPAARRPRSSRYGKRDGASSSRFKTPKSGAVTSFKKYLDYGVLNTDEIVGSVTDENCVYMMHAAGDPGSMISRGVQALLRHLFENCAKIQINSIYQVIPSLTVASGTPSGNNALGYKIEQYAYAIENRSGVENAIWTAVSTATSTLSSLAAAILGNYLAYSQDYDTADEKKTFIWTKLKLFRNDQGTASSSTFIGEIDMRYVTAHYIAKSKLTVQNISTSAFGNSRDAENVTNSPLKGYLYHFPSTPRSSNIHVRYLETFVGNANNHSVVAAPASTIQNGEVFPNGLKEPPQPAQWSNCKSAAKVKIDAGALKTSNLYFSKSQNFMDYLKFLKWMPFSSADTQVYFPINTTPVDMLALEEQINFGDENSTIICRFECDRKLGVYMTSYDKKVSINEDYTLYTYTAPIV